MEYEMNKLLEAIGSTADLSAGQCVGSPCTLNRTVQLLWRETPELVAPDMLPLNSRTLIQLITTFSTFPHDVVSQILLKCLRVIQT